MASLNSRKPEQLYGVNFSFLTLLQIGEISKFENLAVELVYKIQTYLTIKLCLHIDGGTT